MLKVQLTVQVVKSLPCPIHPGKGVVRHNSDRCIISGYSIASSSCVAKHHTRSDRHAGNNLSVEVCEQFQIAILYSMYYTLWCSVAYQNFWTNVSVHST